MYDTKLLVDIFGNVPKMLSCIKQIIKDVSAQI
jgi:hypothetical protein